MSYWKGLKDKSENELGSLAEAAITDSFSVTSRAEQRANTSNPMKAYDSAVIYTFRNLSFLIPLIPDSDVLRAEQLAFRLQKLAKNVNDSMLIIAANRILEKVQARPAYQILIHQNYSL